MIFGGFSAVTSTPNVAKPPLKKTTRPTRPQESPVSCPEQRRQELVTAIYKAATPQHRPKQAARRQGDTASLVARPHTCELLNFTPISLSVAGGKPISFRLHAPQKHDAKQRRTTSTSGEHIPTFIRA